MLSIRLDLSGFHRLRDETLKRIQRDAAEAVRGGLETGAAYARAHHQHQRRTGHLTSDAIRTEITSTGPAGTMGALHNDAPYAGFVEYGTKPHRIYPRTGNVLAFELSTPSAHGHEDTGETIFARYVNHPGTSPMPFMHPARDVGVADMRRRIIADMAATADLWK